MFEGDVLTGAGMPTIGLPSSAAVLTLRRSTSTVSGSGWLVRYATGSLASISTVVIAPSRRDVMDFNAGVSAPPMAEMPLAVRITASVTVMGAANTSDAPR